MKPTPTDDDAFLDELRALLAAAEALSVAHPAGAPARDVAALEERFATLSSRWIDATRNGTRASVEAVAAETRRWRQVIDAMPSTEETAHFEFLRASRGWYKHRPGEPPLPLPAKRSAMGEAMDWLLELSRELRYEAVGFGKTTRCDCEAATAAGKRPQGDLETIGPHRDGYYEGDERRCNECGARWFCGIMDDDLGSPFWKRL